MTSPRVIAFRVVLIVLAGLMGGLTWFGRDCLRAWPLPLEEYHPTAMTNVRLTIARVERLRLDYYYECLNVRYSYDLRYVYTIMGYTFQ